MKYSYTPDELRRMQSCQWLSDRERRVFNLYYRRGWEIERIAAELEVCRRTVDSILHSIRTKCG